MMGVVVKKKTMASLIASIIFHSKRKIGKIWYSLPEDILFEVLKRLCPKTLAKLRCVSKFFSSLVVDPNFKDHYSWAHSNHGPTFLLSFEYVDWPVDNSGLDSRPLEFYSLNYTEKDDIRKIEVIRVEHMVGERFRGFRVRSSANGMICLSNFKGDITICHASTGQHVSLPKTGDQSGFDVKYVILGFDSVSRTYKVVSVDWRSHLVFTLGVDKRWREIKNEGFRPNIPLFLYYKTNVCINGVIYCLSRIFLDDNVQKFCIALFDFRTENFFEISLPEEQHCFERWDSLVDLNGQLAMVNLNNTDNVMVIWTLEKSMKWKKQHTITIPVDQVGPINAKFVKFYVTTTCTGEILLFLPEKEAVFVMVDKFGKQVWNKIEIHGIPSSTDSLLRICDNICFLEH